MFSNFEDYQQWFWNRMVKGHLLFTQEIGEQQSLEENTIRDITNDWKQKADDFIKNQYIKNQNFIFETRKYLLSLFLL